MSEASKSIQKESDPEFINLMDVYHIVRQRCILGFSVGLVVAACFAFFFLNKTPVYEASASMVVELNTENVVNVQEVIESGLQNSGLLQTAMNTHIARIQSGLMAESVAKTLNESEANQLIIGFTGPLEERDPGLALPSPAGLLKGMVHVVWVSDSQVLKVSAKHPDPRVAKLVADRYVSSYIQTQSQLRGESTGQAVDFLDQQTVELRDRLEKEEQALQDYRTKNDLVTVEQNQQIVTERLSQLNTAITGARVRLLGVESELKQIVSAGEDLDQIMNVGFIGGRKNVSEIYNELQALRKDEQVMGKTFLERHPRMIENAAAQEAVESALWTAIRQARSEYTVAQSTISDELASLREKLTEAENEARRLENLSIEYRVLSRKVEAQREIFDRVTARFNETSISQQMNLTSIRILDLAGVPGSPVSPNKKKIIAIALVLFGILFLGLPVGVEFFDNRLKTFADIERFVGKPLIGDLRLITGKSEVEMANALNAEESGVGEAFASIYGSLRLNLGEFPKPLSFVITSSVPGEGKSVVASNLAAELSVNGLKTIIVDCDLRRPSQHSYHVLDNKKGLIEWIRSGDSIAEDLISDVNLGIQRVEEFQDLYLLRTGGSTSHTSVVLEDKRMDELVSRLKQDFDVIIFDTPPVGLFHDATLVADYADYCLFVARQNVTTRQKTRHSVAQMDRSKAQVLGVIFNGVKNLRLASGYGSYGDGNYAYYSDRYQYGYGKAADKYKKDYVSE